ncbi:MAG: XTP/dITP diphosphatase [Deltaproteobacteria bacterium]|nr:XTP/dITP diphosphatase [Deltaproteobacteria bacterium]MBW1846237.1 XTP/dITP diphosphatase [Deltaproteobacteria bacterium]MBW1983473.1 XTP/dITP diphosphatase [Deltaproteobacteria bacterium]
MKNEIVLVLASRNKGKTAEIQDLLKDFPITIKNLDDFGPIPHVEETGATFDENAYLKASFTARMLGLPAMADDSGVCVDALNGAPGVYSARYGGEDATDEQRCDKLLEDLKDESNRKAAFECVISIAVPPGPALTYEGLCEGLIADQPSGTNGFGYDPIFYYPPLKKTFAELSREEKSLVSHRGIALKEIRDEFEKILIWIAQNTPVFEKFNRNHNS